MDLLEAMTVLRTAAEAHSITLQNDPESDSWSIDRIDDALEVADTFLGLLNGVQTASNRLAVPADPYKLMVESLTAAWTPLIKWRDRNGVDINDMDLDDPSLDPVLQAVAEAIDRGFDDLDGAMRALEVPEDYRREGALTSAVPRGGDEVTGQLKNGSDFAGKVVRWPVDPLDQKDDVSGAGT